MSSQESTTTALTLDIQYHTIQGAFVPTVDARKLHEALQVGSRFNDWMTRRIEDYGFVREIDYVFYSELSKTSSRSEHVYRLTLDMAKELCMVERTPKGREARHYFIACEKALMQGGGAIAQRLETIEERLARLEAPQATAPVPDQLTPKGELPPPAPRVRERAEVSWHLAAVWSLLQRTSECLTNHEIAQRTGVALPTARAHTGYLTQLGMLELHETHPRHLYVVSALADKRNPGVYQRLQRLTEIIQARQAF